MIESEHLQVLTSDLAKNSLKDLTTATLDGLDKIVDKDGHKLLNNLIAKRVSKSAAKTARKPSTKRYVIHWTLISNLSSKKREKSFRRPEIDPAGSACEKKEHASYRRRVIQI